MGRRERGPELYFAIRKTLGTRRCPLEGAIVDKMQWWVEKEAS